MVSSHVNKKGPTPTAGSESSIHYRTLLEEVTGETSDISEYLDFAFYD